MIKVEVIEDFTYGNYNEIKDSIVRKGRGKEGWLYVGDTFTCTEEIMKYLTGNNRLKKVVVKVIEIIPEKVEKPEQPIEDPTAEKKKPQVKTTKKSKAKKK